MNDLLTKKKAALAESLREEYAQNKETFFLDPSLVYHDVAEAGDLSTRVFPESGEVMVSRYKPSEAVAAVAFLIISTLIIVNKVRETGTGLLSMIFLLVWISAIIYFIVRSLNSSPRLIFNKESIWLWKPEKNIPWNYIAAGFIKIANHGESDYHYLVIHFYEPDTDGFEMLEINLENMNFTTAEIAGYFDFFLKQSIDNIQ